MIKSPLASIKCHVGNFADIGGVQSIGADEDVEFSGEVVINVGESILSHMVLEPNLGDDFPLQMRISYIRKMPVL
jgi:hypothetical protein